MPAGRTLHVRCPTWEQVEHFHTRKLRRGNLLSMKVPFEAQLGTPITLGLELPNGVTIAIDGSVHKASAVEGDPGKTWIEIELPGFTDEIVARIKTMAAGAAAPPMATPRTTTRPPADELPADERQLFLHLTGELRRLRQVAVHEVLGVAHDAEPDAIRTAWMSLVRRHHPDLVVRRRAPAITHLAEELTILANRAYDRMRAAVVSEGRGTSIGSVVRAPAGWLVGFDDLASAEREQPGAARAPERSAAPSIAPPDPSPAGAAAPPARDDTFESRARLLLGEGNADSAQEVLAAALVVYPRSRPLRSLYYVASAMAAMNKGEVMLATSQLETALAHHDQCTEAARLLDHLRKHDPPDHVAMRRVFL